MSPIAFEIFGKPIYWYGIIIAVSVLLGIYLAMVHAKKSGYNSEIIADFCILAIPIAIICARLYYVIFQWDAYAHNPINIIKIWEGGLAIYGAVIGGIFSAYLFSKWKKISFWDLCDICAPSLILGQALGRWGNFFNQEAYGYAVENPAWQWFPSAVFIEKQQQWHMATFFYESVWNFIVFGFLMFYFKRRKKSGEILLLYLILYSCGRLVIEGLRTDSLYAGPFRVSQLLSGVLIVLGSILFYIRRKRDGDENKKQESEGMTQQQEQAHEGDEPPQIEENDEGLRDDERGE